MSHRGEELSHRGKKRGSTGQWRQYPARQRLAGPAQMAPAGERCHPSPLPPLAMSPKDTLDSAQYRASNQTQPGRGYHELVRQFDTVNRRSSFTRRHLFIPAGMVTIGIGVLHRESILDNESMGPRPAPSPICTGPTRRLPGEDHVPPHWGGGSDREGAHVPP